MLSDSQVKELTVGLFKIESERDQQRKVGASNISDPCTYHLAKTLVNSPEAPSKYWLGAKIGTATHMFIEDAITKADLKAMPLLAGAVVEQKITLGELPGYGIINSKPDLALVNSRHVIDWKTSTREKMRKLQRVIDNPDSTDTKTKYTLQKYMAQIQLYAWGLNQGGTPVDGCSLVFINRDGTSEPDIWTHTFAYSEEFAVAIWSRLERIWSQIQEGKNIEDIPRHDDCFKCQMGI